MHDAILKQVWKRWCNIHKLFQEDDTILSCNEVLTNLLQNRLQNFDNFFTSAKLLDKLSQEGFICVGTVRENRTDGATKSMISTQLTKKKVRGSYDYRCNKRIFVCKWHDNSVVNIDSSHFAHEPVKKVARYVSGKGKIHVPRPSLLYLYNQGMGGIDLMDRLLGSYRPIIRAKIWWRPLMIDLLNASVVSAWRFYCALHPV